MPTHDTAHTPSPISLDDLLAPLHEIDWTANWCNGRDIPDKFRLAALQPGETGDHAYGGLFDALLHQESVYPGSGAAFPFLVAAADHPASLRRAGFLHLAAYIAGHVHDRMAERERADTDSTAPGHAADDPLCEGWIPRARDAAESALPRITRLLRDDDPDVRLGAIHFLTTLGRHADEAMTALRAAAADPDPHLRVAAVAAVAQLAQRRPYGPADTDRAWIIEIATSPRHPDEARFAAALYALAHPAGQDTTYLDILAGTATARIPQWFAHLPWLSDDIYWRKGMSGWAVAGLDLPAERATRLIQTLAAAAPAEVRLDAIDAVRTLTSQHRRGTADAAAAVAAATADSDPTVRAAAAREMAFLDRFARPHADALADAAAREGAGAAWAAVALAHCGDQRAVPLIADLINRPDWPWPPIHNFHDTPHQVIHHLKPYAGALIPALRRRLLNVSNTDFQHRVLIADLLDGVRAWGHDAAPLITELTIQLKVGVLNSVTLMKILGHLGGVASAAVPTLREVQQRLDGQEELLATWALWRITGHLAPFAALAAEQGPNLTLRSMKLIADAGPSLTALTGTLHTYLATSDHTWARVETAHALWRISGNTTDTLPVLLDTARDPSAGTRTRIIAIGYLGEMGPIASDALAVIDDLESRDTPLFTGSGMKTGHELTHDLHCQDVLRRARYRIQSHPR